MIPALTSWPPRRSGLSRRVYLRRIASDFVVALSELGLGVALLAHQAWVMMDAVLNTLVRLVNRRDLLEWRTAAQTSSQTGQGLLDYYRRMYSAPLLAVLAAAVVLAWRAPRWQLSLVFLLGWLASPAIARWISQPLPIAQTKPLTEKDRLLLQHIARRTWHFFESFVGPDDHFLPPDNFQEDPKPVVAHRTSPTNVGLYLLSVVSAYDFGWIGLSEVLERLEGTLNTLGRLEKFKGHLYNWYETRDLRVLEPRYVSSVDSGNLAGHLITLEQALIDLNHLDTPKSERALEGLRTTLGLVVEAAQRVEDRRSGTVSKKQLLDTLEQLAKLWQPAGSPWPALLQQSQQLTTSLVDIARTLGAAGALEPGSELLEWTLTLLDNLQSHTRDLSLSAEARSLRIKQLNQQVQTLTAAMEFDFLYDATRKLFSIGYDVRGHRLDPNCYDLLASESRLTSFIAIARNEVPTGHWFRLGRTLTPVERSSALVSWSGSMFEYLMPTLVMHSPNGSLLEQTYHQVVARQISYGRERGVPWGVSESALFTRDRELTYQYSAFGLPGLGLKRGLAEELVISPYSTALGAMIDPNAAVQNFVHLMGMNAYNRYGFYDALDFTAERLPDGVPFALVRTHMAHHQGMSLVALANVLLDNPMQRRFLQDIRMRATATLLHERTPPNAPVARPPSVEMSAAVHVREMVPAVSRHFSSARLPLPQTHLLSNGRYTVMLTTAGSGYSRWKGMAVTRWREDATCDDWGSYIYLRDVRSGQLWSATAQPTALEPSSYEAQFYEERARFFRRDGDIASTLQVLVSPEDDAEIRRVALRNYGEFPKEIELASYAEVVLSAPAADNAHPAFSKLFIHTEFVPELGALLATRRPRTPEDPQVWAAHVISIEGNATMALQFETDRARFLGRGQGVHAPASLLDSRPFAGTAGNVLDPIFSLRTRVRLEPGEVVRVGYTTLLASSREEALTLADKYRNPAAFERTQTLAWTDSRVELSHLGIEPSEAALFQELTGHILYANRTLRASSETVAQNQLGQPALWKHGISGDLPIMLVRVAELGERELVRQMMRAYQYWRRKRLAVDLVILDEEPASYVSALQDELRNLLRVSQPPEAEGLPGDVFVLQSSILSEVDLAHLQSMARVLLSSAQGTLAEQLARIRSSKVGLPARSLRAAPRSAPEAAPLPELRFFNGLGGFAPDGKEYLIALSEGQWTPTPWINVVANPNFGFLASESGGGYTWSLNSRENKLTPWSNDPVSDPMGEVFYIRDEETGEIWNPTSRPIRREGGVYTTRHGAGYSVFERSHQAIRSELLQFVPLQDPLKVSRLRLENRSARPRRLSITAYTEWVLGVSKEASAPQTVTELDSSKALFAWNNWNPEFAGRVAFADLGGQQSQWTADRTEFLGRGGTLQRPAALEPGTRLLGKAGATLDPCAVLQTSIEIPAGGRVEVVHLLGQTATRDEARALLGKYRRANLEACLQEVKEYWEEVLGKVEIKTPDPALDLLLNRWLLYQTLACRIWGRSGFYQAGGAFGFRDQLQDGMALALAQPTLVRQHLIASAARQFVEGDVQHWWHPPSGRGVRTHISDDLLWLPYALTHYLEVTGDHSILDEVIPFIEGPPVPPGQEDLYYQPEVSAQQATLYDHCARILERSLQVGEHGLPLIGSGDWNDGLNRVGEHGKGESVWLGWFLHTNLWEWASLAESRGHKVEAKRWRTHVRGLKRALEREAWDGDWYKRAFFDDGTPLGSAQNTEARIDSIAQSWAVLSGAAATERAHKAMTAVEQHLVRPGDGLVLLFTPPFEHTPQDPGYIKGYPAGVRENGGQYTHAAVWSAMAFAALGQGDQAGELLSMLNPINHSATRTGVHHYKVEPYVMAADVYAVSPHVGRGGWTWYTGSAGWMYRAGLEWLLGFRVRGQRLFFDPCIPKNWPGFEIVYRHGATRYEIKVENPHGICRGVSSLEVDGAALLPTGGVELVDDGKNHQVRVVLG